MIYPYKHNYIFLRSFLALGDLPPICRSMTDLTTGKEVRQIYYGGKENLQFPLKISDVPGYLELDIDPTKSYWSKRIPGLVSYCIDLSQYSDMDAYLRERLSAKSRSSINRYKKKLEECFQVTYQVYTGSIDPELYDLLFAQLRLFMERRFEQKKESNYELPYLDQIKKDVWSLLKEKKANLFVILCDGSPISIRINMIHGDMAFYILSAYNTDFEIFRPGKIDMLSNISWFKNNGFRLYDLLKGYGYIKERWANKKYLNYGLVVYKSPHMIQKFHLLLYIWIVNAKKQGVVLGKYLQLDKFLKTLNYKRTGWSEEEESSNGKIIGPSMLKDQYQVDWMRINDSQVPRNLLKEVYLLASKKRIRVASLHLGLSSDKKRYYIKIKDEIFTYETII